MNLRRAVFTASAGPLTLLISLLERIHRLTGSALKAVSVAVMKYQIWALHASMDDVKDWLNVVNMDYAERIHFEKVAKTHFEDKP